MNNTYLSKKKEFIAVDYFKFIIGYLVINIHIHAFANVNATFDFWFTQVFSRIAVPFFFITAGFFAANKINDKKKIGKYILRLVQLYLCYTALYIPKEIYENIVNKSFDFGYLLQKIFIVGLEVVLWYFVALIVAILILFFFVNYCRFKPVTVISIASILYVVGTLGQAYRGLFDHIPFISRAIDLYYKLFLSTENGVLFGLLFVAIGYYIKIYAGRIKKRNYCPWIVLFGVLVSVEGFLTKGIAYKSEHAMMLLLPAVSIFIFLQISFVEIQESKVDKAKKFRQMQVLIYGLHMLVDFFLQPVFNKVFHISLWDYTMMHFIVLSLTTTIVAYILLKLSNVKGFRILRKLY